MLELDGDFFGKKMECVGAGKSGGGPPWAHEIGGAPRGCGRALHPRGHMVRPPGVFLKEICPRGNNKVVIYISLYHDKCLLFMLEFY